MRVHAVPCMRRAPLGQGAGAPTALVRGPRHHARPCCCVQTVAPCRPLALPPHPRPRPSRQAKLGAVQAGLEAELAALQQGLGRRQEMAAARATLELMQEVANVASKVEKLLSEVAAAEAAGGGGDSIGSSGGPQAAESAASGGGGSGGSGGGSGGKGGGEAADADAGADAHALLLERVAAEVSRLGFLAHKGEVRGLQRTPCQRRGCCCTRRRFEAQ